MVHQNLFLRQQKPLTFRQTASLVIICRVWQPGMVRFKYSGKNTHERWGKCASVNADQAFVFLQSGWRNDAFIEFHFLPGILKISQVQQTGHTMQLPVSRPKLAAKTGTSSSTTEIEQRNPVQSRSVIQSSLRNLRVGVGSPCEPPGFRCFCEKTAYTPF